VLVVGGARVTGDTDAWIRAASGGCAPAVCTRSAGSIYPRGLGFGDVRLAGPRHRASAGSAGALLVGVYAGFLLGGVLGGLLAMARIVERKELPFGPFMLLGLR
jgi:leader peptidase (prepilin peptidase)/N-methyltransferase